MLFFLPSKEYFETCGEHFDRKEVLFNNACIHYSSRICTIKMRFVRIFNAL